MSSKKRSGGAQEGCAPAKQPSPCAFREGSPCSKASLERLHRNLPALQRVRALQEERILQHRAHLVLRVRRRAAEVLSHLVQHLRAISVDGLGRLANWRQRLDVSAQD